MNTANQPSPALVFAGADDYKLRRTTSLNHLAEALTLPRVEIERLGYWGETFRVLGEDGKPITRETLVLAGVAGPA
jgi:hypothetical protein